MAGAIVGVDHVGYVVTDLEQATRFFIDVLGFRDGNRRGELRGDGDRMTRLFGVDPGAVGRYAFLEIGDDKVELLEWSAPERGSSPRNSDVGGRHVALAVREIDGLLSALAAQAGVTVRERNERGFYYVGTPFGLEIQLVPV